MFSIILNVIGSLFHFYVAHRLHRVPFLQSRVSKRAWWIGALVLWLVYLWGVHLGDEAIDWRWYPGQFAMTWLGVLFLMTLCLLAADLLTGFGFWWRRQAPRFLAVGAAAGILVSAFAIFQAVRAPAVSEYEVALEHLPANLDGMVLVAVSDIHLGAQRRSGWMAERVAQINALKPDAVLMVGDQVEDNPLGEPELAGVLRALKAPRGVWAVTGNHEFYGDVDTTITEFSAGGVRWLRNEKVELAPGLVLAGIDDIGRSMRGGADYLGGLETVFPEVSDGKSDAKGDAATILLCHIPATRIVEGAAARGVGLMLSGHTHGGQIWPFNFLVERRFPRYMGEYRVGDMSLVVSRGAGGWGPRMRLWRSGEIVKLTLRSPRRDA